jgi:hypothetical protein
MEELPKLGVEGSNPFRRSRFLVWESLPANIRGSRPERPLRVVKLGVWGI